MSIRTNIRVKKMVIFLALAAFVLSSISLAYQTDEELKKKYAPILGSYEFDMTDYGMGIMLVEVYVEYGSLWAFPETSDSAGEMIVVEGEELSFKVEDPDEGTYKIKFLKDEEGNYTKCQVINEFQGMDVIGTKIK
jgi:hypothetical protein